MAKEVPHCTSTKELLPVINGFTTEGREGIILKLYTTEYEYVQQLEVIVEVSVRDEEGKRKECLQK